MMDNSTVILANTKNSWCNDLLNAFKNEEMKLVKWKTKYNIMIYKNLFIKEKATSPVELSKLLNRTGKCSSQQKS